MDLTPFATPSLREIKQDWGGVGVVEGEQGYKSKRADEIPLILELQDTFSRHEAENFTCSQLRDMKCYLQLSDYT